MDKTIDRIITLKNWLEFILIILIPYRGYLVFADGQGTYYIVRQIIHLIGWIMLYIFVSNYNPLWKIQESFQKKYATKMKKISLAATVVLAVKLFILVTYYILSVTPDLWSVVNISTEILAWLFIMGVFAYSYNYWKQQLLELEILCKGLRSLRLCGRFACAVIRLLGRFAFRLFPYNLTTLQPHKPYNLTTSLKLEALACAAD